MRVSTAGDCEQAESHEKADRNAPGLHRKRRTNQFRDMLMQLVFRVDERALLSVICG